MKAVYLASKLTMPGSKDRRYDAFEHDQMMCALVPAFEQQQSSIVDAAWDDTNIEWSDFDAAIIGTTWDYCDRFEEFMATIEKINRLVPVFNSPELLKWNANKAYLKELEAKGAKLIPTDWVETPTKEAIKQSFNHFKCNKIVVKQQVGANAEGQYQLNLDDEIPELNTPMMVQPFLTSIVEEGEYSFIFIGGDFSHALLKTPAEGDYRIQSSYGGKEQKVNPTACDINTAKSILELLDETPLYARVDMIRSSCGSELLLMELEVIEPFLYPEQGEKLGNMMAAKIHSAVKNKAN